MYTNNAADDVVDVTQTETAVFEMEGDQVRI